MDILFVSSRLADIGSIICLEPSALDLMTIDPEYQRQGLGGLLMNWGLAIVDRLGVEVISICYHGSITNLH